MTGEELDALMAKDAAWFRENPDRRYYIRPYVFSEFEPCVGAVYSRKPTAAELRDRLEERDEIRDAVAALIARYRNEVQARPFAAIEKITDRVRLRYLVFGKDPDFMLCLHGDGSIRDAIRDALGSGLTIGVKDIDAQPKKRHRDRRQRHR